MPGRTHMQTAMPSSVGLWADRAEALLDSMEQLTSAYRLWNQCPLGSAASYGVPLLLTGRWLPPFRLCKGAEQCAVCKQLKGAFEAVLLDALDHLCLILKGCTDSSCFRCRNLATSLPDRLCSARA